MKWILSADKEKRPKIYQELLFTNGYGIWHQNEATTVVERKWWIPLFDVPHSMEKCIEKKEHDFSACSWCGLEKKEIPPLPEKKVCRCCGEWYETQIDFQKYCSMDCQKRQSKGY